MSIEPRSAMMASASSRPRERIMLRTPSSEQRHLNSGLASSVTFGDSSQKRRRLISSGSSVRSSSLPAFLVEVLGKGLAAEKRHFLQHQTADAGFVACELDLRFDLFARREVVRHGFGEGFTCKTHHALIGLGVGIAPRLVENERATTAAACVDEFGHACVGADLASVLSHRHGDAEEEAGTDFRHE